MPPAVETGVYRGRPAWHGLGHVLDLNVMSVDDVFAAVPEFAAVVEPTTITVRDGQGFPLPADAYRANVRRAWDADHVPLPIDERVVGVTRAGYQVFQPYQQVQMLDDLLADGAIRLETAVSLRGGSVTVLVAHVPDGAVRAAGDTIDPYVLLVNSYDGSYALTFASTPVRVECQNMMVYALGRASRAGRIHRVRHTAGRVVRLDEVRASLGLVTGHVAALADHAERLARISVRASGIVERVVPVPAPETRIVETAAGGWGERRVVNQRAIDNAHALRAQLLDIHANADHLANHRGTAWGVFQAVSTYFDHVSRTRSAESRFERYIAGTGGSIVDRAASIVNDLIAA